MVKPEHKPLRAYRTVSLICFVLLAVAFIMYLLVTLSLPIIKGIYLIRVFSVRDGLPTTSIATELRFGVWGACASSALKAPSFFSNEAGECIGPQLGYKIPPTVAELVGLSDTVTNLISTGLLAVLVLHPIAGVFAFMTLVFGLFLASHVMSIIALVTSTIAAILGLIVSIIDLVVVYGTKSKISDLASSGLHFNAAPGNALWMILVAMIFSWASVIALSARTCYCCGVRRKRYWPASEEKREPTTSNGI